jgi:hypothetical protein
VDSPLVRSSLPSNDNFVPFRLPLLTLATRWIDYSSCSVFEKGAVVWDEDLFITGRLSVEILAVIFVSSWHGGNWIISATPEFTKLVEIRGPFQLF